MKFSQAGAKAKLRQKRGDTGGIWREKGQEDGHEETKAQHSHPGKARAVPKRCRLLSSHQQQEGACMCVVFLLLG